MSITINVNNYASSVLHFDIDGVDIESGSGHSGSGYVTDSHIEFTDGVTTINQINNNSSRWSEVNVVRSYTAIETITIDVSYTIPSGTGTAMIGSHDTWTYYIWDVTGSGSDTISLLCKFYLTGYAHGSDGIATVANADESSIYISYNSFSHGYTITDNFTEKLPTKFMITMDTDAYMNYTRVLMSVSDNCLASFTKIPRLIYDEQLKNKCTVLSKIEDVKAGDEIETNIGDQKIARVMKSINIGGKQKYVKFRKNCFGENIPNDDVYMTKAHPLSLGYFKTECINDGVKDKTQSNKVFVHIEAYRLIDKLDGIELVEVQDRANYNLIFDNHCSINICGLDVVTHHPIGNNVFSNPKLKKNEFIDYENACKKNDKPFYIDFKILLKYKPVLMPLKQFLRKCFVYDVKEKFKFVYIDKNDNILRDHFRFD